MDLQEIKILVAIDFGTTYSSFAYVSKENPENIIINSSWPGREGCYKTPTVLKYNESYTQVISWERKWPAISFPQQVGLILTIPSESPHYMKAMRECVYNAGFLTTLNSANLEFITEQEAVVLHCLSVVKDHNLHSGDSFLVADCGDDTVDIILRKFPQNNKLDEITKRAISSRVHQYGSGPFLDVISDWFRTFFRRHLDRNNVRKFDLYGSLKCVVYSVEFYYKKNGILLLKKSYKISSS
ncbi:unnamed protein product [Rhizophagus irregularis]|uniref:Hsp70 family protein n=1 Tax=Rhizophagus irregularis TaxID=588596 RepID=A0A915ZKU7_9GLOM|nr:unnamed protein product [Rhizophagus irregularis]